MEKIITETAKIARENFEKFGFNDEQILQLLESGKRDLTLELSKLQQLLKDENTELDDINLSLHALKGLFLTMGNTNIGNKLNELHKEHKDSHKITEIKHLLDI